MSVLLPLASSAGWFEGATLLHALALRLKVLLLLEADLVVERGGFLFRLTKDDARDQHFDDDAVPWPRGTSEIVGIKAGGGVLELRMDFQPLVVAAGLGGRHGVRLSSASALPSVRRALRQHVDSLMSDEGVIDALPDDARVRRAIVKHWMLDAAAAATERASLAVDVRASSFVRAAGAALVREGALRAPRPAFSFLLHDVRQWEWEGVLRFRESAHGARLRSMIDEARRAYDDGSAIDEPDLQQRLDALTGRGAGARSVRVACVEATAHQLLENTAPSPRPVVYLIGEEL